MSFELIGEFLIDRFWG